MNAIPATEVCWDPRPHPVAAGGCVPGAGGCPGPLGLPAGTCPRCRPAPHPQAARTLSLGSGKPLQTSARGPTGLWGPPLWPAALAARPSLGPAPGRGTLTAGPDPRVRLAVVLALLADRAPVRLGQGFTQALPWGLQPGACRGNRHPRLPRLVTLAHPDSPVLGSERPLCAVHAPRAQDTLTQPCRLPRGGQGQVCEREATEQFPWG